MELLSFPLEDDEFDVLPVFVVCELPLEDELDDPFDVPSEELDDADCPLFSVRDSECDSDVFFPSVSDLLELLEEPLDEELPLELEDDEELPLLDESEDLVFDVEVEPDVVVVTDDELSCDSESDLFLLDDFDELFDDS